MVEAPTAFWLWKYALGGFAVQDLWLQPADRLPAYLEGFGRDYLLTGLRVPSAEAGRWRVAWASNCAGEAPGDDFGTFEATVEEDRIVLRGPALDAGIQRVVFSDISRNSFVWTSQYSSDEGTSWLTVMRVEATRLR